MVEFSSQTCTSRSSRATTNRGIIPGIICALSTLFFTICPTQSWSQTIGYPISFAAEDIRTVQLHPLGVATAAAIVPLNGGVLDFAFDDFSPNNRRLEMRWRHCTFDWFDSPDLVQSDYINGFTSGSFESIEASFNTKANYVHYRTAFPNELMSFSLSGNYIVEVYDADEPESILVQRRFTLYENEVEIDARVLESTIMADKRTHQEIDFTIDHGDSNYPLYDAYDALQTVILQNGRWESAVMGIEPQFVRGTDIVFNPTGDESFYGGNSWRFADLKSTQFSALGIQRIEDGGAFWHVFLEQDEPRTYAFHQARQDIDGHLTIANDRQENTTGSEYVQVHFSLKAFEPMVGKDIYIFGGISNWDFPPTHRLIWNDISRQYEATLLLKQGYYNYLYLTRDAMGLGKSDATSLAQFPGNVSDIEGSHSRADNMYQVLAYYWDMSGYDRVIGYQPVRFGFNP